MCYSRNSAVQKGVKMKINKCNFVLLLMLGMFSTVNIVLTEENASISTNTVSISSGTAKEKKVRKDKKKAETNETIVTFIELGSVRCIPCKKMQPIIKELEEKYSKKGVKVIFYDVWTEAGAPYAKQYRIMAIPTQVFIDKDGKEYFRHTGFFEKKEILKIFKMKGIE
jgi:thioredoxin 1